MDEVVYVVRQFNAELKCLAIFGVYKEEDSAIQDLRKNHSNMIFDETYWLYKDLDSGFFYRIDAFTLK